MDFIRSIVNDSTIVTDDEVDKFLQELNIIDEPRYTAREWAAIEGGHSVDDVGVDHLVNEDAFDRIAKRVAERDIIYYRLIVGAENLMRARLF